MKIYNVVRKNTYYDSVSLMLISKQLKQIEGLDDVSVMMGTPANRVIMQEANLLGAEGEEAGPNDLIIGFRAVADVDVEAVLGQIDDQLGKEAEADAKTEVAELRSVMKAYQDAPDANLVIISVPGEYADFEAERALKQGKNVFLFSDNVPLEAEVRLKKLANEKGLLVMGPDCGTAFINGTGIGFANKLNRGNVGLVSAAGTGLQEVTCLLDSMGLGISQAIGTGGRDLKEDVGALTMLQALDMLLQDDQTETIVLISKPPAQSVVEKILNKLAGAQKQVVICFLGSGINNPPAGVTVAANLEEAALAVAQLSGKTTDLLNDQAVLNKVAEELKGQLAPQQKYVRALYAGGTLCYEAMLVMTQQLGAIYSNTPLKKEYATSDILLADHHTAMDLGDDQFTLGRPHPMIDGSLRYEYIERVAKDAETAVLLLDVVIGYGAGEDPAGELVPIITAAKDSAAKLGNQLAVVAYVCGTNQDDQNKQQQIASLRQAGVFVAKTNAEAARLAAMIAGGLEDGTNVRK